MPIFPIFTEKMYLKGRSKVGSLKFYYYQVFLDIEILVNNQD